MCLRFRHALFALVLIVQTVAATADGLARRLVNPQILNPNKSNTNLPADAIPVADDLHVAVLDRCILIANQTGGTKIAVGFGVIV